MREPCLALFCAFACGLLAAHATGLRVGETSAALAALLALALLSRLLRQKRAALLCLLLACVCAGALRLSQERARPFPQLTAEDGETVILEGCVAEPPSFGDEQEQFLLALGSHANARITLYVRDGETLPALRYGQHVEVEARVRQPRNFQNPGSFDLVYYLARKDVHWTASGPARDLHILPGTCGSALWSWLYRVREATLGRIHSLPTDERMRSLMAALLVGDYRALERDDTEAFRRTGTYHALVVSGLHMSVLGGVLLFVLRGIALPAVPSALLATLLIWLYALVVGVQAPVLRAAGAFTLLLAARLLHRRPRPLNLLAVAGLVFVVLDPEQLFDASFQLSFGSVALIVGIAAPWLEHSVLPYQRGLAKLDDRDKDLRLAPAIAQFRTELRLLADTASLLARQPARVFLQVFSWVGRGLLLVWQMVALSFLVQAGLVLPMAVYFHRVPLTAAFANLLVTPLLSAAVPLGLLAAALGDRWTTSLTTLLLRWSQRIAVWHLQWEPAWRVPAPPLWLGILALLSLVVWALALRHRARLRWAAASLALMLAAAIFSHPFAMLRQPGTLELTAIDVSQGDSLLVVSPQGRTMLVDGGGVLTLRRKPPKLDIGESVVSPYLWSRSVRRLDVVAVTHAHADHLGGIMAVLDNFRPRELWVGLLPEKATALLQQQTKRLGVTLRFIRAGEPFAFGGASIQALSPVAEDMPEQDARNNDSLVLLLRHGRHSFLLTGDMEQAVEARLLGENRVGHIDVLKVAHHGSRTSTTLPFVETVHPALALISAGLQNQYRHPHPDVVRRLEAAHATVLRTDQSGLVTVRSDGQRLTLEPTRWPLRQWVTSDVMAISD